MAELHFYFSPRDNSLTWLSRLLQCTTHCSGFTIPILLQSLHCIRAFLFDSSSKDGTLQLLYLLSLFSIGFRACKFGITCFAFSLPGLITGFLCVNVAGFEPA